MVAASKDKCLCGHKLIKRKGLYKHTRRGETFDGTMYNVPLRGCDDCDCRNPILAEVINSV